MLPFAALLITAPAPAQLRVVDYNIAQLQGNLTNLQNVIAALQADDKAGFAVPVGVFMFQEVLSTNVAALQSIIDTTAPQGVTYALATYTNNNEDDFAGAQAMFYRTDLLSEIASAHADIYTGAGRRGDRWKLQLNGYSAAAASVYAYSAHLKSSLGFESERLAGAQAIRSNADALGAGLNIIFAGDWNLYVNTEPAYLEFISSGNAQAFDPLGTGSWAGSGNAIKHTQSPRLNSNAYLVGGGLDDRFDFQLSTAPLQDGHGLSLLGVPFVYRSLGNDGNHYNTDINAGNNTYYPGQPARSNALADNLHEASDHIPVVVDYQIPAMMAASMPATFGRIIQGATYDIALDVTNPAPVEIALGAEALDFTATGSLGLGGSQAGTAYALGGAVAIHLPLNTANVGAETARATLNSTSQGAEPSSIVLNSTGTIVRHANPSFSSSADINTTTVNASFATGSGSHIIPVPVYNFGYNVLQALLDVDSVSPLSSPFGFSGGLTTNVGAIPATLNFSFDTTGRPPGAYLEQTNIHTSDENLPGEAIAVITLNLNITITAAACSADVNGDGHVNVDDLLAVITAWGTCPAPPAACPADVNHNGVVTVDDLLSVITAWGPCP